MYLKNEKAKEWGIKSTKIFNHHRKKFLIRKWWRGYIQNGGHRSSTIENDLEVVIAIKQYDLMPTNIIVHIASLKATITSLC